MPQVFFSDLPDSYVIPTDGNSYRIMNALYDGLRKKTQVPLIVNQKTKNIIDLDLPPASEEKALAPSSEGQDIYIMPTAEERKAEKDAANKAKMPQVPSSSSVTPPKQ